MYKILMSTLFFSQLVYSQSITTSNLKCIFTEPFLSVDYSPQNGSLKVSILSGYEKIPHALHQNTMLSVGTPGEFLVKSFDGETLLSLTHDGRGSDGMSEIVYPVSAVIKGQAFSPLFQYGSALDVRGGCRFVK